MDHSKRPRPAEARFEEFGELTGPRPRTGLGARHDSGLKPRGGEVSDARLGVAEPAMGGQGRQGIERGSELSAFGQPEKRIETQGPF